MTLRYRRKFYGGSVIGSCLDCAKEFGDYKNRREAYEHARRTGHRVAVEITTVFHYNITN